MTFWTFPFLFGGLLWLGFRLSWGRHPVWHWLTPILAWLLTTAFLALLTYVDGCRAELPAAFCEEPLTIGLIFLSAATQVYGVTLVIGYILAWVLQRQRLKNPEGHLDPADTADHPD